MPATLETEQLLPEQTSCKSKTRTREFFSISANLYIWETSVSPGIAIGNTPSEVRFCTRPVVMWISPDPARQFASLYSYTGNGFNPVNGADEDGEVFNPIGASVGAVIGLRNIYIAQKAYYENGGKSYGKALMIGATAYTASVVAGGYSLGGEGALAATSGGMLIGAGTATASSILGQKVGSGGNVDYQAAATEGVKGGLAGALGGWLGSLVGSALGANLVIEGKLAYPAAKAISEVVGQGAGQIVTENIEVKQRK